LADIVVPIAVYDEATPHDPMWPWSEGQIVEFQLLIDAPLAVRNNRPEVTGVVRPESGMPVYGAVRVEMAAGTLGVWSAAIAFLMYM
jgi:hypothetical protein